MTSEEEQRPAIETPTTVICVRDDGIVLVTLKQGAEVTLEAANENDVATKKLVGERSFLLMVDIRAARAITREAREFFADPEVRKHTIAQAFLIDSGVSKVLGNFYLRVNKPPFPTKLFTSEESAVAWLNEHRT